MISPIIPDIPKNNGNPQFIPTIIAPAIEPPPNAVTLVNSVIANSGAMNGAKREHNMVTHKIPKIPISDISLSLSYDKIS